ncbi:MAG: CPBP family intramembrane metalloprotease [Verrucomicrobia bacterium]|nr:CPBP family intramembrane metalloprotease [Verrucomicrobiota bacterium]
MARGARVLQRSYVLLPLVFGLALLSACIASPFVKILNDELAKTRPLGKVFTKCLVGFTLVYFLVFRGSMRSKVVASLNIRISSVLKQLIAGLLIGVLALAVVIAIFYIAGAKRLDADFTVDTIWMALLTGLGVALVEEIVFRGVVLQNLQADMDAFFAVVFASAFFAAMHFVQPLPNDVLAGSEAPAFNTFHVLNGFRLLPYQLANFGRFDEIWPFFLGLFLFGIVLSVAYLKAGSLYLPIGIHAGLVTVIKFDKHVFSDVAGRSELLFGIPKDWFMSYTDSLICWLVAVVLIVLLIVLGTKLRAGGGSSARTGGRGES